MYVEKKKGRYGVFYVLRAKESEIETVISNYEYLIDNCIKEEYRNEFKEGTIRLLRKCNHDEKYDKDDEVSCILKDNDTWDFLHAAFNLLAVSGSVIKDDNTAIELYESAVKVNDLNFSILQNMYDRQSILYDKVKRRSTILRELVDLFVKYLTSDDDVMSITDLIEKHKELLNAINETYDLDDTKYDELKDECIALENELDAMKMNEVSDERECD